MRSLAALILFVGVTGVGGCKRKALRLTETSGAFLEAAANVVCCEPPAELVELGRIHVRRIGQVRTSSFWVRDTSVDLSGMFRANLLRFTAYPAGQDPAVGAPFDESAEPGQGPANAIETTTEGHIVIVWAIRCDWGAVNLDREAKFELLEVPTDDGPGGEIVEYVLRMDCSPDPGVVFTAVIPDLLDDPNSLITRFGPGANPTGHVGVVWADDFAQLAGVPATAEFFPSSDFIASRLRRTADRTQAALLSFHAVLTGGDAAGTVNFFDTDLFHVDLATGDIRRLTTLRDQGHSVSDFSWSADGTKIAMNVFDVTDFSATIRVFDLATRELTTVASFDPVSTGLGLSRPVWSPDGNRIAYSFQSNVHVLDLVAETDTRIVDTAAVGGPASNPDWHPTEDRIVHTLGEAGLRVVDSTGALLDTLPGSDQPEWSPDGDRIVAGQGGGSPFVAIIDVATGEQTVLPESDGPKYHDW